MHHRGFGSDNHSGIHPQLLEAIALSNKDHAPSYGTDLWTQKATESFHQLFGKKVDVFFVFNGTAANVLSIRSSVESFESVLCADVSHINQDECGAPEILAHCKLIPLKSRHGKLTIQDLEPALIRLGDQHATQPKLVSLTQPTEYGVSYSNQEIEEICEWAHEKGLYVHIDGARIANAVTYHQTSFEEMFTKTGVDVVSFGGTKNGFAFGEAVIFLNPSLGKKAKYLRKQLAQLPSKSRFIAAQFETYLKNDLWRDIARHSHQKARELYDKVRTIPGVEVTTLIESNGVFAKIPKAWVKPLKDTAFFYVWDETTFECRWMTSWDTQSDEINQFAATLQQLSEKK